jgi:hypothetical protein
VFDARIDVEALLEQLDRRDQQFLLVLDHVAYIVGQAAVRERHELAFLEHDDVHVLVLAAQSGRAGGAAGDTSDDDYGLGSHKLREIVS